MFLLFFYGFFFFYCELWREDAPLTERVRSLLLGNCASSAVGDGGDGWAGGGVGWVGAGVNR